MVTQLPIKWLLYQWLLNPPTINSGKIKLHLFQRDSCYESWVAPGDFDLMLKPWQTRCELMFSKVSKVILSESYGVLVSWITAALLSLWLEDVFGSEFCGTLLVKSSKKSDTISRRISAADSRWNHETHPWSLTSRLLKNGGSSESRSLFRSKLAVQLPGGFTLQKTWLENHLWFCNRTS